MSDTINELPRLQLAPLRPLDLLRNLAQFAANDLRPTLGRVITVKPTDTLQQVMDVLTKHNILSAPVLDAHGRLMDWIDFADIALFVIRIFDRWTQRTTDAYTCAVNEHDTQATSTIAPHGDSAETGGAEQKEAGAEDVSSTVTIEDVSDADADKRMRMSAFFDMNEAALANASVNDILIGRRFGSYSSLSGIPMHVSVLAAIDVLARSHTHRLALVDDQWSVQSIITQSSIIAAINKTLFLLPFIAEQNVMDMSVVMDETVTVHYALPTIKAFALMQERNVSGVAVIDDNGVIMSTLSIRDLRAIRLRADSLSALQLPVWTYKQAEIYKFPNATPIAPIYVTAKSTVGDAIARMMDGRLHRIWMCRLNDNGLPMPERCISQRTVLLYLMLKMSMTHIP